MANERRISIKIDTYGDVRGIDAVIDRQKLLESQSGRLFGALKAGAAIDIGGRLVGAIAALPGLMERAIDRGVQFNATLETSALGIAAVMKQFDTEKKFKTFDDAMAASTAAIDMLKQAAKESPATFQSLVQSYQALSGPLTAANIPMEKQIKLIVNMSQALSGLGISSQQLLQETRALVTGNINADAAAAKILGITAADVSGAKAKGQLYEFLSGKIESFAEAGKRGAGTYQTAMSNLDDAIDDVLAKLTKPIFQALTKGTLDLSEALNDPTIVESLRDIGVTIAGLVEAGYDLTKWAIENKDALILVAKAATALSVAYTAIQIKDLLLGVGLQTAAWVKSKLALDAETASLATNTAAQLANAAARSGNGGGGIKGALNYGRSAEAVAAEAAAATSRKALIRSANLGQYSGSVAPLATAGAGEGAAAAGSAAASALGAIVTAGVAAIVVTGLVAMNEINKAEARAQRIAEMGDKYSADTAGNVRAMAGMANPDDRLAVLARFQAQEDAASADRYAALADGDAQRLQMAEQQLKFIQLQRGQIDAVYERVNAVNGAERSRLKLLKETDDFLKKSTATIVDRAGKLTVTRDTYEDVRTKGLPDEERLKVLRDRRRNNLPSDAALGAVEKQIAGMSSGPARDAAEQDFLARKTEVLRINQEIAEIEKKIADNIADQSKKIADQKKAREDYVLDIQILEARANGMNAAAEGLERQKALRDEIRKIVDATGVSEEQAEAAARRKLGLEYQIAQQKNKAPDAATARAGVPARNGDRIGITGAIGTKTEPAAGTARGVQPVRPDPYSFAGTVPSPRPKVAVPAAGKAAGAADSPDRSPLEKDLIELAKQFAAARGEKETQAARDAFESFGEAILNELAQGKKERAELAALFIALGKNVKGMRKG